MRRTVSFIVFVMLLASLFVAASAEESRCRAVIGADLTDEQIWEVYRTFGIVRGSVPELRLTNADELKYLEGIVDSAVIGTKSISCVYLELLSPGSGLDVSASNISVYTPEMYKSALSTAGITDARLIVTAPFPVSGTAALAGAYKAYGDMTPQVLDSEAMQIGTQELTITGELAQEIGSMDSMSIVQELRLVLDRTSSMSDAEIGETVNAIASKYRVSLTDTQVRQLITLCRSLERLDPDSLKSKVEDVQNTFGKVSQAKDQVTGFVETVKNLVTTIQSLIEKIQAIIDKF